MFGMTFNDCEPLADLEAELNNVFAVQFYASDTQQHESSFSSDQVPILAVNVVPSTAADEVAV